MVVYFADRKMNILGVATTELPEGFTISDDLKTEDTDTGVATFECTIHWTEASRSIAEEAAVAGNYLLRSYNNENEFYTILESQVDTKDQSIYIYAEDAGMDLLNETVGEFAADEAHPIAWYVEKYAEDTGFEIGLNEISSLSRKLEWTGEATAAERIASVATQFDNAEISYSFDIEGLIITHKYINIHKKRGKDVGVQLRLNRDVDRIITTTSVADLATALYVTGGIPEGEEDAITLAGYKAETDDGDIYSDGDGLVKCKSALAVWSRYVWAGEPNQVAGETGHIVKQWSYDTTSQSELFNRAVTQLGKVCEPAVNYEIDIQQLPANVAIGDTVDIVDEKGELYLQSRILQLTTSACDQKQTATLGEFLIKDSGISATVRELAEQFAILAQSRTYYTWVAYADDDKGNGISLDPDGKEYMGTASNRSTMTVDISDPSIFTWVKVQGVGIETVNTYYGVSDSPTVVPTEWTTTPVETLRNEYEWSYTETVYTDGRVETTAPHIVAYYDYLEVDELDAKVANIKYLLAGQEEVEDLTAIHLTGSNVVIDNGIILDAMIADLSADKITAGTIYTNYVKIADDEDHSLWIDGATIQLKDDNGVVRIQMGMDASGDYDYYLMDESGNITWDARGLTEKGLVANGAIIRDEAVANDAAIQGKKLDIDSVIKTINDDGTETIHYGKVDIDGTSMNVWYADVTDEMEVLQSEIKANSGNIELLVSWTDFDESVASSYSLIDMLPDKLTLSVAGSEYPLSEAGQEIDKIYADRASLVLEYDSDNKTARMTATAGEIYLTANQKLVIDSTGFELTKDGYIKIDQKNFSLDDTGYMVANSGTIGAFTINSALYTNSKSTLGSSRSGVYIGSDGISLGTGFVVDSGGALTSTSGSIGGLNISGKALTGDSVYLSGDGFSVNNVFVIDSDGNVTSDGSYTSNTTWGASAELSGADLNFYCDGKEYGHLGMLAHNLGSGSSAIHTYTPSLSGCKSGDGVTLAYYGTKNGYDDTYAAISILQGDLYSYYGDDTYRIYFHEATYIGNLTVDRITANKIYTSDDQTKLQYSGTTYGWNTGNFVWVRFYNTTASTMRSALNSFPTPRGSVSVPMTYVNNSISYVSYAYYNGTEWLERVVSSYASAPSSGSNWSGGYYGVITYYTG